MPSHALERSYITKCKAELEVRRWRGCPIFYAVNNYSLNIISNYERMDFYQPLKARVGESMFQRNIEVRLLLNLWNGIF